MKCLLRSIFVVTLLAPMVGQATDATWVNNGTIVVATNIDATSVINNGSINIITTLPFDTSNTRHFTNSGSMSGTVGFRFDYAPTVGPRQLAANFHNRNSGTIFGANYLLVQATNIFNQGTLNVGANGLMQLTGTNINIARSGLAVNSLTGTGSSNTQTNFTPDTAITDNYWAQTNDTFDITGLAIEGFFPVLSPPTNIIYTNLLVSTPPHAVSAGGAASDISFNFIVPYDSNYTNVVAAYTNLGGGITYSLTNDMGGVTNFFALTNIFRQAVFVAVASTNFDAEIRFSPSLQQTNRFRGVGVRLTTTLSNLVTQTDEILNLYFSDTLASAANRGTLPNSFTNTGIETRRPANYILSRQPVVTFSSGVPGNATFTNDFLYSPLFTNETSFGPYAGYSATIDNLSSRPPAIPAGDVTNNPGRIEIRADTLDMNRARIRTEGLLSIQANHLISSSNAVVDSENISLKLASTNGNLQVQGLMKETVARLRGTVSAFSFVWTNSIIQVLTNYDVATNPPVAAFITNTLNVNFHVLMFDARGLQTELPVNIYEFQVKATNVVVNDNGFVGRTFLVESESLTLNGNLTLWDSIQNWTQALVPLLKHFTNNGALYIPNEAHFGDEGPVPYLSFVNSGSIQAFGQTIRSEYVLISGTHSSQASFNLNALDATIDGGFIFTGGDISLAGGTIKLNQAWISSGAALLINVTNSLSDDGAGSFNEIDVRDGFYMFSKPATGDLLGTAVYSVAPNFAQVNHVWAGRDDGVSTSGYSNNLALGSLTLVQEGLDPLFVFSGAGAANGLYVDLLDLSGLTNYSSQLQIDPNLVIYFATATLNTNSAPTNGLTNEEFLDGQFAGRLRWVEGFLGPNSFTNVVINGNQIITVSRALRDSLTLDSDADGTVNGLDPLPFDGVVITSIQPTTTPAGHRLTWNAAATTTYRVEASTNLTVSAWNVLFTTTTTNTVIAPWTVQVTNTPPANVPRYYRITYNPNQP